jgi:hypothetical protein
VEAAVAADGSQECPPAGLKLGAMPTERRAAYREITRERADEFAQRGYGRRYVFSHRVYYLPKPGPDGYQLAQRMCGRCGPDQLWEAVLYADRPLTERFPPWLFFDDDLIWHRQQFGRAGQVATASLVLQGPRLYSVTHVSDLVQRISRHRKHKTRVESTFKGWNHMLLNSVLAFALERRCATVYVPTAGRVIEHSDPGRRAMMGRALYERIYDRHPCDLYGAQRQDGWWVIDVARCAHRVVLPARAEERLASGKTICVCHDIERGWGHRDVDAELARAADTAAPRHLDAMLAAEDAAGVKTTYNVVGAFLGEVRAAIEARGHSLAFHSYDHHTGVPVSVASSSARQALEVLRRSGVDQLLRCRRVDYRLKGYRAPQSEVAALSDDHLCFHNFEWLASAAASLRAATPRMEHGIAKIPILFDDHEMYARRVPYVEWERRALARIRHNEFVAFGLHDCYAHLWLPHYGDLLQKLRDAGTLATLDAVAGETILASAV